MSFSFVTAYPWWFLIVCPLAGFLAAGFLYSRSLKKSEAKGLTWSLFGLRFLAVTFLTFLLLGIFIRKQTRDIEKPVIVFAQDDSESLVIGKDSTYLRNDYRKSVEAFIEKLGDEYDVQAYSFGSDFSEGLKWSYKDKETDFSGLFSELEARFSNRNLGAVILASDGIYNKGTNPLFSSANLKAPFFSIALGDTNPRRDLFISRIAANRMAYLGNTFPLQVIVDARKCEGNKSRLTVSKDGKILYSSELSIDKPFFSHTVSLQLEAKETGVQRYTVNVSPVNGELSIKNNTRDVFIDVLDSREKILIVGRAPHPDLGAIRNAIESSQTYQADVLLADDVVKPVNQYNLVILHSIPFNSSNSNSLIQKIREAQVPVLYIAGNGTDWNAMNTLYSSVTVSDNRGRFNEVQPSVNRSFSLFQVTDELRSKLEKFPPLSAPFGIYRSSAGVNVLLFQKIGMVATQNPLMSFTEVNNVRTGMITGDGLWKWRMTDYALHGDHAAFNELFSKIVQFLSSKVNKSQFRINAKNSFAENESVEFDAELYNESFEPVNEDEVGLVITNSDGRKFPFTFSKTATAYHLNAGTFPPGEYSYEANVKGKKLTAKGRFIVTQLIAEQTNTVADHLLLNNLSEGKGGSMYYPDELEKLFNEITARKDITSVSYVQTTMRELIEEKWLFALILLLFGLEWFIRKYNGLY